MSSISNSNLLKPAKSLKDIALKSKILSKVIARGTAISLSVSTVITQLGLAKIAILSDAFLPLPICVIVFSLLYELIPDSYSVIKKKILQRKNGDVTQFEQSELNEIKMIIDDKIEVLTTSRTVATNNQPLDISTEPVSEDAPIDTTRSTIYHDGKGNMFTRYKPNVDK